MTSDCPFTRLSSLRNAASWRNSQLCTLASSASRLTETLLVVQYMWVLWGAGNAKCCLAVTQISVSFKLFRCPLGLLTQRNKISEEFTWAHVKRKSLRGKDSKLPGISQVSLVHRAIIYEAFTVYAAASYGLYHHFLYLICIIQVKLKIVNAIIIMKELPKILIFDGDVIQHNNVLTNLNVHFLSFQFCSK